MLEDPRVGSDFLRFSPYIYHLWFRGLLLSAMGRHDEAKANLDRAFEFARQHDDAENLGWIHGRYVTLAQNTGCTEAALGHARQAVEIAEKIGSSLSGALARQFLGGAYILTEEWSQAADVLQQALDIARGTRTALHREPYMLAALAQAFLGLGDNDRARATADEAVAAARRQGTRFYECIAHITRASVLLRSDGATATAEIQTALSQAQALVEETGGRSQEPFIHEERANLARLTGDDATYQLELREAHRLFTEMGATGHAQRLAKELGL